MSNPQARVGARIRKLRLQKGLSQREVAEPELTAAYLSLIESGSRAPSESVIRHIAQRLGVEPDEILLGRPSGLDLNLELALQEARAAAHRGEVEASMSQAEDVLKDARRYRLPRFEARALCVKAALLERKGDLTKARQLYEEAEGCLLSEPAHLRFEAVVGYARCTQFLDNEGARMAIYLLERYLAELEHSNLDDPTARMRVLSSLVHLYRAAGHERRSIAAAEEAQRLGANVADPEQVACMNMNVARALVERGLHDDALIALREAEKIYQSLDWPLPEARSKINRGIVEVDKGRLDEARATFHQALAALADFPEEKADRAAVLDQLGRVERLLGDADRAITYLKEARSVMPPDDVFEEAFNAREMGLALEQSIPVAAQKELRRSADLFKSAGAVREVARVLVELGRILREAGHLEKANDVLLEGLELNASSSV